MVNNGGGGGVPTALTTKRIRLYSSSGIARIPLLRMFKLPRRLHRDLEILNGTKPRLPLLIDGDYNGQDLVCAS
jgi:hypothetical protein